MTKSMEDYLEAIYVEIITDGVSRIGTLAKTLDVKMPSVHKAVTDLASEGFLDYEKYRDIRLTKIGKTVAKKIYEKHLTLKSFLMSIGVSETHAEDEACLMEHILSPTTIACLKKITKQLNCEK